MDARIAAYVAARLLALYLLANNVLTAVVLIIRAVMLLQPGEAWTSALAELFGLAAYLAGFSVFWFGAGWISQRLAEPLKVGSSIAMDVDRWKALALAVSGAMAILWALKIITDVSLWKVVATGQVPLPGLACEEFVLLIYGGAMIAFQNQIVKGINALCAWANTPFISPDET